MKGSPFAVLSGIAILAFLLVSVSGSFESPILATEMDIDDSAFIRGSAYMFPENFLSRFPHEADSFRLKIFVYLIFNLFVKGHGARDPAIPWSNYNRDDFGRVLIDATFYEYLTNFTDNKDADWILNPSETTTTDLPESSEEITVDRIGQYLDRLSEAESKPIRAKTNYEFITKLYKQKAGECDGQTQIESSSGYPGYDYPNFCDIPETSFSCGGKRIPGVYADYETGCQVFHVCWPQRMDSFLCPVGTKFNQSTLTCDFWEETGCYHSPLLYYRDVVLINGISKKMAIPEYDGSCQSLMNELLQLNLKFMPVKCIVRDYKDSKNDEAETKERDNGDFQLRLEIAYDLIREMLGMLRDARKELADAMENRGTPWIKILEKRLDSSEPASTTETMRETTKFARKYGEADIGSSKAAEQESSFGKLSPTTSPSPSVTSTPIKPSKSLNEHLKSLKKQDVPEIVMESLNLGGSILNEGLIPIAKKVIMDSYRKIQSKKL